METKALWTFLASLAVNITSVSFGFMFNVVSFIADVLVCRWRLWGEDVVLHVDASEITSAFGLNTRLSGCVIKKRLKSLKESWQRHKNGKIFHFQSPALSHLLVHLFSPFFPFSGLLWWAIQLNIFSPICLFRLRVFLHIFNNLSCVKVKTFAMRLNLSASRQFFSHNCETF